MPYTYWQYAPLIAVLVLCLAHSALGTPVCRLRPGLYKKWWRLERGIERASGPVAKRFSQEQLDVDRQYVQFFDSLAETSMSGREESFDRCLRLAKADPFASQVATLIVYVHGGRKDPGPFLRSLPSNKRQLADFWKLDSIAIDSKRESLSRLPGIPLPDGLVEKITDELYALILDGNDAAAREYFYLYANSDGAFAEFLADRSIELVRYHPDVVLRLWGAIKPYMRRLASDGTVDTEDYKMAARNLRTACEHHKYASCSDALRVFR